MRIEYWKCDRCKKEMQSFKEIETIGLWRKTFELCGGCTIKLKDWFKENGNKSPVGIIKVKFKTKTIKRKTGGTIKRRTKRNP